MRLRPVQVVNRYTRRLARLRIPMLPDVRLRAPVATPLAFCRRQQSLLGPASFRFLNAVWSVESPAGWDDPGRPRLWNYNLHYFDDLNAEGADGRSSWHEDFVERWLLENPPPSGTAWEPYPASLRTVNLVKWALRRGRQSPACLRALAMSARAVRRQLEFHLLGNHLFANAKALFFAGLSVESTESDSWLRSACSILRRQVPEQILADGGQFELSPMYHAIALEDALDIVNLARAYSKPVPADLERVIPAMLSWLQAMTHPDGEIAFFNDAALGIAAEPAALIAYAAALGHSPTLATQIGASGGPRAIDLAASGYARLENRGPAQTQAVAICDAAAVAPDYLPGHAHADSLSFELSIGGQRVIVNTGTSTYAMNQRRAAERSTRGHTTIQLANADSSEVWDSFRCGARASILSRRFSAGADEVCLQAAHDGYRFLAGHWIHQRIWTMGRHSLHVQDRIFPRRRLASLPVAVAARFILHPAIEPRQGGKPGEWLLCHRGARVASFEAAPGMSWAVEPVTYAPEFGVTLDSHALVGRCEAVDARDIGCVFHFGRGS